MKKLFIPALVAAIALVPAASFGQSSSNDDDAAVGAAVGGTQGAIVGGLLFGPVGAIFGGFTGAVIGAEVAVPDQVVTYAATNPVDPIFLEGEIGIGYEVSADMVYPIPGNEQFGYFYANGRAYIVDMTTFEIVHSPGYVIPADAVAYVEANPAAEVNLEIDLSAGTQLPGTIQISAIPNHPSYGYVYIDGQPVLVDASSRTVVWVQG